MLDLLWAGWRSAYVTGTAEADDRPDGCLFCALVDHPDADALILGRHERCFAVLNRFPYNPGHLMVAPYRHVAGPGDLTTDEHTEVWEVLVRAQRVLGEVMGPDGFNIGANLGRVAGAGVPGHLHLHVVPRWVGDTNFMTTVGGTRVLPEDLVDTWAKLRAAYEA